MTPSGTNLGDRPARSGCVGLYCIPVSDSCDTFSDEYSQGSGVWTDSKQTSLGVPDFSQDQIFKPVLTSPTTKHPSHKNTNFLQKKGAWDHPERSSLKCSQGPKQCLKEISLNWLSVHISYIIEISNYFILYVVKSISLPEI